MTQKIELDASQAAEAIGGLLGLLIKPDHLFKPVPTIAGGWQVAVHCAYINRPVTGFSHKSAQDAITRCRWMAADLIKAIKAQTALKIDQHLLLLLTDDDEPEPYTDYDIDDFRR